MIDLKLSTLRGLLGNVFPTLRAVCVESRENLAFVCFYCDGEISEDDHECCESTLDDVIGDFCYLPEFEFETPFVRLDYPKEMPLVGEWVYYRHEGSSNCLNEFKQKSLTEKPTDIPIADLKLSVLRGLLGNVFPSLRSVCVNWIDNLIQIHFYYDIIISGEERGLCKKVIDQVMTDFSTIRNDEIPLEFETAIIRLDYPKKMPIIGQRVFRRQEDTSQYID